MNERVNPFAGLTNPPNFDVKPKPEKVVPPEIVDLVAEQNNFPSRQVRKKAAVPARPRRVYRTGRNRSFSLKATNEAVERFYKMADDRKMTLGALLELALDALEAQAHSKAK